MYYMKIRLLPTTLLFKFIFRFNSDLNHAPQTCTIIILLPRLWSVNKSSQKPLKAYIANSQTLVGRCIFRSTRTQQQKKTYIINLIFLRIYNFDKTLCAACI